MHRSFLELVARTVNIDPTATPNDSKLEQKVIYALKTTIGDAVRATGTLTSDTTAPSDGDTVTIDTYVYTYKTALTASTTAFQVLIGASAATALTNLKSAINGTGTPGTDYGSRTTVHPSVTGTTLTATALTVQAIDAGTEGNAIATTETSAHLSWGGATLSGGAAGTYYGSELARSQARMSGGANV